VYGIRHQLTSPVNKTDFLKFATGSPLVRQDIVVSEIQNWTDK
jgi:hypothetical protein